MDRLFLVLLVAVANTLILAITYIILELFL